MQKIATIRSNGTAELRSRQILEAESVEALKSAICDNATSSPEILYDALNLMEAMVISETIGENELARHCYLESVCENGVTRHLRRMWAMPANEQDEKIQKLISSWEGVRI